MNIYKCPEIKDDSMETVEELRGYVRYLYGLLQEKNEELSQMKSGVSEMKVSIQPLFGCFEK